MTEQVILDPRGPIELGYWRLPIFGGHLHGHWVDTPRRDPAPAFSTPKPQPGAKRWQPPARDVPIRIEEYRLQEWKQQLTDGEAHRWCYVCTSIQHRVDPAGERVLDALLHEFVFDHQPIPLKPRERAVGQMAEYELEEADG